MHSGARASTSDGVHAEAFSSAATVKISATKGSQQTGYFGLRRLEFSLGELHGGILGFISGVLLRFSNWSPST